MARQGVELMILFILGSALGFGLAWYLLGLGTGVVQRGYSRVSPYRIQHPVVEQPASFRRRPNTWDDWEGTRRPPSRAAAGAPWGRS